MCYLPPENSSRYYDMNMIYDTSVSLIKQYKSEGILYLCGDLNSRCGDNDDFIRGIDDVIEREVIDFNPFMPCGLCHPSKLNQFISKNRDI